MRDDEQRGFTFLEVMISMALVLLIMGGVYTMLVQNARVNKSQQLISEVQSNARACLSLIVQQVRTAGWDPMNSGLTPVVLDPDLTDDVSQIEVFADLSADGDTNDGQEQVLIRHRDGIVEWRPTSNPGEAFMTLAVNISNDSDGDGVPEPMFSADSTTSPKRITVQITAESPIPDPVSGEAIRYTLVSQVALRQTS